MGSLERDGEIDELVVGQSGLDEGKEGAFLVADVGVQPFPELVQVLGCRCRFGGEVGGAAAEVDVIGEHADDRVVRGRAVTSEGGEQDVFLDSEVLVSFLVPEAQEGIARGGGVRVGGTVEALGDDEPVVVVAGELGEGVAAFHGEGVVVGRVMGVMVLCLVGMYKRSWGGFVAYVINEPCIGVKDNSCVEVCPVDCIHPTPDEPDYDRVEQLFIDPQECIDCDACVEACPVDAITSEDQVPAEWQRYIEINAAYYRTTTA